MWWSINAFCTAKIEKKIRFFLFSKCQLQMHELSQLWRNRNRSMFGFVGKLFSRSIFKACQIFELVLNQNYGSRKICQKAWNLLTSIERVKYRERVKCDVLRLLPQIFQVFTYILFTRSNSSNAILSIVFRNISSSCLQNEWAVLISPQAYQ